MFAVFSVCTVKGEKKAEWWGEGAGEGAEKSRYSGILCWSILQEH